ncbi:TPA: PFL family protein [Candidatus Poribacteria bacterium]|nr:PFL family protein [Candidatus Poribacteria bacterium]
MPEFQEILETIKMIHLENLDVRAVTMGISLWECADGDNIKARIREKILKYASNLVSECNKIEQKYGIPIVNKRIAVSPIALVAAQSSMEQMIEIAVLLDKVCEEIGIDLIGGYSALVHKGIKTGDQKLMDSIPMVLSQTERVCSAINVASTKAGINIEAIMKLGNIIKDSAIRSKERHGFACAKLVVFANIPEDNPFMAGASMGVGEPDCVINVGVSGPGVVKKAVEDAIKDDPDIDLGGLAEVIKKTSFKVTRVGELIGREIARQLNVAFGIVDLSLAPTPKVGDSVGEILETLGLDAVGAPGTTAALAMLNDAVKKGGLFASSSVGGLSGAFIPVSEDIVMSESVRKGTLTLEKLEAMTSVCSVGLDMIAIPGDTDAETISAIIADEMAIGIINNKTTAVRLIPVPGMKAGEKAVFGGLFGEAYIVPVPNNRMSRKFIRFGGRIPAPLQSINN